MSDDPPPVAVHPPVLYGGAVLLAVALEWLAPLGGAWPGWLRFGAGGMLMAGGAGLALWAAWLFQRAGTNIPTFRPALRPVFEGPYRFTRNPMYLGVTAFYAGLALAVASAWMLLLLPPVLLVMDRFVIAREEPYLDARFGQPYRDYKTRVRRWL